jgi:hypothetical protein
VAEYFNHYGGKAVFIDEIQKYDGWQRELKTLLDIFGDRKIVVSGSSSLLLNETDSDLKRRRASYELPVLSFREYLEMAYDCRVDAVSLSELLDRSYELAMALDQAIQTAPRMENPAIMRVYKEYLKQGQYAYCIDARSTYLTRLTETISAVIEQDICKVFGLPVSAIDSLKKMYTICAVSEPFTPNYMGLGRELGLSKDTVKKYFVYLAKAGLIRILKHDPKKISDIAKDKGKILVSNTNNLYAVSKAPKVGTMREVEFACATSAYSPSLGFEADFVIGDDHFEIGGPNKTRHQIGSREKSYLVLDDVTMPRKGMIPLYLFGLLR